MPVPTDDPLDILLLPPPDETPAQRTLRLEREEEAKRVSLAIDASIKAERAASRKKRIVRLLLLGQSESGKSTTLRQFQRLYTPTAFREERILWRAVIQLNIVRSIRTILDTLAQYQYQASLPYMSGGTPTPASPYASPKARSRSISRTRQSPSFPPLKSRGSDVDNYNLNGGTINGGTNGGMNGQGGTTNGGTTNANGTASGSANFHINSPPRYPPPLPPPHGSSGPAAGSSSSSASSSQRGQIQSHTRRPGYEGQPRRRRTQDDEEVDEYGHDADAEVDVGFEGDEGEGEDGLYYESGYGQHVQGQGQGQGQGPVNGARKASPSPSRVYAHGGQHHANANANATANATANAVGYHDAGSYPPSPSLPTHGHLAHTHSHSHTHTHTHTHQPSLFSMHSNYAGQAQSSYSHSTQPGHSGHPGHLGYLGQSSPSQTYTQHSSYSNTYPQPQGQGQTHSYSYSYANSQSNSYSQSIHSSSYVGIPTTSILYPSSPSSHPASYTTSSAASPPNAYQTSSPLTYASASTASSSTLMQTPLDALRMRLEPLKEVERVLIWRLVSGSGSGAGAGAGASYDADNAIPGGLGNGGGRGVGGEIASASFEYENQGEAGQDSPEFGGVSVSVSGGGSGGGSGLGGPLGTQAVGGIGPQGTPEIFVRPGMGWKSALARARVGFGSASANASPTRDGGRSPVNGQGHTRSLSDRGLSQVQGVGNSQQGQREGEDHSQEEQAEDPSLATLHILHALKKDMITLWTDLGVKEVLKRRKVRLEEGSGFFLNDLPRLLSISPPYLPTDDDVLRARLKTVGVSEYKFEMEVSAGRDQGTEWRIVDVGGSRSMRPTWVPFFDTVDAILFLAPISGFDQVLLEDRSVNRLEDSVLLWKAVCSSKLLANVDLVLFLNKCDILERKLRGGVRMAKYVRSYGDRPNDLDNVSKYLRGKFSAIHREYSPNPRKFYAFCTSVTDTTTTAGIIASVRDMVIRQHLKQSKLL